MACSYRYASSPFTVSTDLNAAGKVLPRVPSQKSYDFFSAPNGILYEWPWKLVFVSEPCGASLLLSQAPSHFAAAPVTRSRAISTEDASTMAPSLAATVFE